MKFGKFEIDGGLISVSMLLILTFLTIYFAFKYDTMLKIEQEKTKQLEIQMKEVNTIE